MSALLSPGRGAMTEPRPVYATDADTETAGMSDLERAWQTHWRRFAPSYLPEPVREHHFHPDRRWRFDFAWPEQFVAVELQGGLWQQTVTGRGKGHAHPKRITQDCEKLNEAQILGWCIFYFTADMLRDDPARCIRMVADKILERMPC